MSNSNATVLLSYTDQDGDSIVIYHDPLPYESEDLWIGVTSSRGDQTTAVRISIEALRVALDRHPGVAPHFST